MRIALILFGISYVESIQHWTGNLFKVDYKESLQNYKEYIWKYFKNYNIDVFFSTYQSEKSKELLNDYKPLAHHFFPSLNYITNFKRIGKNSNIIKAIEITLNYSKKKHIQYDLCIITRFDLLFQIPFEKTSLHLNMFNNTSELETQTRICDNFYIFPGHMLEKLFKIIKDYGIAGNHHFLKYKILKHFKINYIYNEKTNISKLHFYKINRIPINKLIDIDLENIIITNTSKNIPKNKSKNSQKNTLKNIPKNTSKNISKNSQKNTLKNIPKNTLKNSQKSNQKKILINLIFKKMIKVHIKK
jgi:hypothetical protein